MLRYTLRNPHFWALLVTHTHTQMKEHSLRCIVIAFIFITPIHVQVVLRVCKEALGRFKTPGNFTFLFWGALFITFFACCNIYCWSCCVNWGNCIEKYLARLYTVSRFLSYTVHTLQYFIYFCCKYIAYYAIGINKLSLALLCSGVHL